MHIKKLSESENLPISPSRPRTLFISLTHLLSLAHTARTHVWTRLTFISTFKKLAYIWTSSKQNVGLPYIIWTMHCLIFKTITCANWKKTLFFKLEPKPFGFCVAGLIGVPEESGFPRNSPRSLQGGNGVSNTDQNFLFLWLSGFSQRSCGCRAVANVGLFAVTLKNVKKGKKINKLEIVLLTSAPRAMAHVCNVVLFHDVGWTSFSCSWESIVIARRAGRGFPRLNMNIVCKME